MGWGRIYFERYLGVSNGFELYAENQLPLLITGEPGIRMRVPIIARSLAPSFHCYAWHDPGHGVWPTWVNTLSKSFSNMREQKRPSISNACIDSWEYT